MKRNSLSSLWRALGALAGTGLIALAFSAYLRPGFVLDIATRLWLCF